jgi:hypothetical protein
VVQIKDIGQKLSSAKSSAIVSRALRTDHHLSTWRNYPRSCTRLLLQHEMYLVLGT